MYERVQKILVVFHEVTAIRQRVYQQLRILNILPMYTEQFASYVEQTEDYRVRMRIFPPKERTSVSPGFLCKSSTSLPPFSKFMHVIF